MPQLVNPFETKTTTTVVNKPSGEMNQDAIEDLLNADDEPIKEVKVEKTEDDEEDEEPVVKPEDDEDEDKIEIKESEDEDDDEDLSAKEDDDLTIEVPPKKKEILSKYPEFFKEFPSIEKMIYRDKRYTELFGSFDDAVEVANKVEQLDKFESQLLSGNTVDVLKSVKSADPKAFDKIVDNYLTMLHEVDKDAYLDVCGNLGKHIIVGMVNEAKSSGNEELKKAAQLLNQYLFSSSDWTPPKVRVPESDKTKDSEIARERQQFIAERFESAKSDLEVKVDNTLRSTISEYIDPRGTMTAYEKKNAIKEAMELLHSTIGRDKMFRKNLDRLWRAAFSDKFNSRSLDKIRSSYLGRARDELSSVIKKVRQQVKQDSNRTTKALKSSENEEKEETSRETRKPSNAGRPLQQNKKATRQQGESVEEFFMRD